MFGKDRYLEIIMKASILFLIFFIFTVETKNNETVVTNPKSPNMKSIPGLQSMSVADRPKVERGLRYISLFNLLLNIVVFK